MKKNTNIRIFKRNNYYILFDKKTKNSFTIGEKEFELWDSLDGRELYKIDSVFSGDEKIELLKVFEKAGLLENSDRKSENNGKYKKALIYPDAFLERHAFLMKIYWYFLIIGVLAIIPALFLFDYINMKSVFVKYANMETGIMGIIFVIVSLSFHEMSHAVIAKKNGAVVPEIGIMLNFILPCAYTTVCDSQKNSTVGKKIQVALAGMGGNVLLTAIGMYIYLFCKSESGRFFCIEFILANIIPILGNINIFYRDDSYVVIESLLGIKNLKNTAKVFLMKILKHRKFRGGEERDYTKEIVLFLYAIGAYVNEFLFPFILFFLLISIYD